MDYKNKLASIKEETKQQVVAEAYKLFTAQGVDAVSLDAVAKASDIAPTSLYRYFGNKLNLLLACGQYFWKETLRLHNPAKKKGYASLNGYQQASALLSSFATALIKYPEHLRFLRDFNYYMEKNHVSSDTLKEYDESISEWYRLGEAAYQKGLQDHSLILHMSFEEYYFTATHMLLSFAETLACEAELVPSDSFVTPKKQIQTAVDMALSYIKP